MRKCACWCLQSAALALWYSLCVAASTLKCVRGVFEIEAAAAACRELASYRAEGTVSLNPVYQGGAGLAMEIILGRSAR